MLSSTGHFYVTVIKEDLGRRQVVRITLPLFVFFMAYRYLGLKFSDFYG